MKFLWLIAFFFNRASLSTDAACEKSLGLMSHLEPAKIEGLYNFKRENRGSWVLDQRSGIDFVLEPKKITTYLLKWKVRQFGKSNPNLQDGEINCEIPFTWQLKPKKTLQIIYPPAAHGQEEDSFLHSLTTFAGIYLGKSKFDFPPDVVGIMWHLNQTRLSEEVRTGIIASYPFMGIHNLSISENTLDKNSEVQLIALHFSQARELDKGEQRWLVTDAQDQDAIKKSVYKTPESKHNGWLPWLDPSRSEFSARTPLELYKTTVVAGLDQAKIYNRSIQIYVPEQGSVSNKMQMVYDIIAPLVRARMDNNEPLFTHLLFKTKSGYALFGFEILKSGTLEPFLDKEIIDPSLIGLPSALELGFISQTDSSTLQ